jgi:hypothetical protein
MRYILDDNGYIDSVSCTPFNCKDKSCQEYTGTIPDGYLTLDEWALNANIRAYKIVDNNLVYDETKDAELKAEWEKPAEIADTGWLTLNNYIKYRKKNGLVYVIGECSGSVNLTVNGYKTVGTLPTGYRPSTSVPFAVDFMGGNASNTTALISSNGAIDIYTTNATSYWRFSATFPID